MKPLVLIVGRFRSGTSLVAQLVNRMGWQVAPLISVPAPPSWRSDWEDSQLTTALMSRQYPTRERWVEYLKWRRLVSRDTGFGGRIAIKSPYLALVWDDLTGIVGEHAVTVRVSRGDEARRRSLEAHPALSDHADRLIGESLALVAPDVELAYEALIDVPALSVGALAADLGVEDDAAIRAAIALVEQPREYGHGLQAGHAGTADGPGSGDRGPRERAGELRDVGGVEEEEAQAHEAGAREVAADREGP